MVELIDFHDIERFWLRVEEGEPDDCWLWTGSLSPDGYGKFSCKGRDRRRSMQAHRVSWFISRGAIANGLFVCHKCDVPACVNPAHLFLGTNTDNMRDMHAKGRGRPVRGSVHPRAKLTEREVPIVRAMYKTGISQQKIADIFEVNQKTISKLLSGGTWKHV